MRRALAHPGRPALREGGVECARCRCYSLYFYISSGGELYCLDAATGKELWKRELGGQYWASPVLVGQRLYVVNTAGVMSAVSTSDGQVQSTVKLPGQVTASPAVLGGRIYIRTASQLMCIGRP
ncbi:MAG: PQQ-binding-like beta-propeller repeat protein [Planctomycetota bacterium]|nr:PQQ-binding-like beta-propeller repeat protein [Planctomycetota bacterium]